MQARGYPLKVTLIAQEMTVNHKTSDACFAKNMSFWHEHLPKGNKCPTSFEEAKKIVCPLDLPHVKYRVCMNNCIIYRDEHAESVICPVRESWIRWSSDNRTISIGRTVRL